MKEFIYKIQIESLTPIDCVLSAWTKWSTCGEEGTQTRTRTIITAPQDGGEPCGDLVETRPCDLPSFNTALRSGRVDYCGVQTPAVECNIIGQAPAVITNGDVIYDGAQNITPLDGGNQLYEIKLDTWTGLDGTRLCRVSEFGEISEVTEC
jgi:hypothetical protein